MCLAVPGKVIARTGEKAVVDFNGVRRTADLSLLGDVRVGDYVLVHVGFGIQKVDERTARENYRLLAVEFETSASPVGAQRESEDTAPRTALSPSTSLGINSVEGLVRGRNKVDVG